MNEKTQQKIQVLNEEIKHLESLIKNDSEDKGHIHTTIRTLKDRVKELKNS